MYIVYDCDVEASYPFHNKVDSSWDNARFNTFEEAVEYTNAWLGIYSPGIEQLKFVLGKYKGYNYGMGNDVVYIRREN